MNSKTLINLNPRFSSDDGCQNIENFVSLTDSDVQKFLEGKKTKIRKEKPKVTYSVALVMVLLAAENENWRLEDLSQADFGRATWKQHFLMLFITNTTLHHIKIKELATCCQNWDYSLSILQFLCPHGTRAVV